jgi:hypothetical protein
VAWVSIRLVVAYGACNYGDASEVYYVVIINFIIAQVLKVTTALFKYVLFRPQLFVDALNLIQ